MNNYKLTNKKSAVSKIITYEEYLYWLNHPAYSKLYTYEEIKPPPKADLPEVFETTPEKKKTRAKRIAASGE